MLRAVLSGLAVSMLSMSSMGAGEAKPVGNSFLTLDIAFVGVLDSSEERLLAQTIWGEARGDGEPGMRAVAHVILNRVNADERKFGGASLHGVTQKRKQFSCWNVGDPNRAAMLAVDDLQPGTVDHRRWEEAKQIAADISAGRSSDPTGGALFYHTNEVRPVWSKNQKPSAKVSNHIFYRSAAKA